LLSKPSIQNIENVFQSEGLPASIKQITNVPGGCINNCHKIETGNDFYFLKVNETKLYPDMFKIEAKSLSFLKETRSINIPGVIAEFQDQTRQYLLLEWIESSKPGAQFWESFAEDLANLHQNANGQFGLAFDNYIGSLKQSNTQTGNWLDFYTQQRIQPQIELAFNNNKINLKDVKQFQQFYKALANFFPNERPGLIHGDLWNGNFLCNQNQQAVLIDPAIYYANREMEIAFTQLFGGFHPTFYQIYNEIYPLEKGFKERVPVYNLYSLLVHLNLFGGHYYEQAMEVVKMF